MNMPRKLINKKGNPVEESEKSRQKRLFATSLTTGVYSCWSKNGKFMILIHDFALTLCCKRT